jgi:hypothetical protein
LSQPVVERIIHGVAPPGSQTGLNPRMQFLELVTDLGFGAAGDLSPDGSLLGSLLRLAKISMWL